MLSVVKYIGDTWMSQNNSHIYLRTLKGLGATFILVTKEDISNDLC